MQDSLAAHDLDRRLRFGGRSLLRLTVYGFIYWVVIVSALEPGNITNALSAGVSPRWGQELLRIVAAGLLGSVTVPAFVYLSWRFPVGHPRLRRNALIQLACAVAIATILIVVAHVLAMWLLQPGQRLTIAGLRDDLGANELLLVAGLIALSCLAHLARSRSISSAPQPVTSAKAEVADDVGACPNPDGPIESVEIKVRGLTKRVSVGDIDWIEAQGNYVALHVGGSAFLMRETLASFQTRLDPARFIRIHRRTIVALDRIRSIEPAANGDGIVQLRDDQALRVSRLYRKALAVRMPVDDPIAMVRRQNDPLSLQRVPQSASTEEKP